MGAFTFQLFSGPANKNGNSLPEIPNSNKTDFRPEFQNLFETVFWLVWASGKAKIGFETMDLDISASRVDFDGSEGSDTRFKYQKPQNMFLTTSTHPTEPLSATMLAELSLA